MNEYTWFDRDTLPPEKTAVLVRLEGYGQKEFIGFHTALRGWFIRDAKNQGVKLPTKVVQWSHGPDEPTPPSLGELQKQPWRDDYVRAHHPTPTPSAHSGEGKPSDWAIAEAFREYLHTVTVTAHTRNALMHILDRARELERKHEQSEPEDSEGIAACLGDDAAHLRGLSKDGAYDEIADNMEKASALIYSHIGAPPPSEQAGISDEVAQRALKVFWAAYDPPNAKGGMRFGRTHAGIGAVLKWYESAFPRGVVAEGKRAVELTVCCGREECGGECGNDWRGTEWVAIAHPDPEAQAEKPVGHLNVSRFRGSDAMVNTDFDYLGDLPDGNYPVYLRPQPSASETPSSSTSLADAKDAERWRWVWSHVETIKVTSGAVLAFAQFPQVYDPIKGFDYRDDPIQAIDAAIEEQRQLRTIAAQRKEEES